MLQVLELLIHNRLEEMLKALELVTLIQLEAMLQEQVLDLLPLLVELQKELA